MTTHSLQTYIRDIPDFPIQGIMFRDITTLLKHPEALKIASDELTKISTDLNITKVVGIESRGFIFGAMLAERLGAGFVLIRKPKKLPSAVFTQEYELEYGKETIQIHQDSFEKGDRVLIHDDVLATGGTALAAANLVEKAGGEVVQLSFLIELTALAGRERLKKYNVGTVIHY